MYHVFDSGAALKYGLAEAVLLTTIRFWISFNRAHKQNFRDGRTWTYSSLNTYHRALPFLSPKQLRNSINSLVEQGVLLKNLPKSYDRTAGYAFSDEGPFIYDCDVLYSEQGPTPPGYRVEEDVAALNAAVNFGIQHTAKLQRTA